MLDVYSSEREFQRHVRAELASELRTLLVDKVPEGAKYAELRSLLESCIKSAFDSGVVDKAFNRAALSFKRQQTSNDSNGLSSAMQDSRAILLGSNEVQEDGDVIESGVSPPVAQGRPTEQHSFSSTLSTDFHLSPATMFHTSQWMSDLDSRLNGAPVWPFTTTPLDQLSNAATQITERAIEDWIDLSSDTSPAFSTASGQYQENS